MWLGKGEWLLKVYEPPNTIYQEQDKTLAGLSYISVLFLPFIFPLIVMFIAKDSFTKKHAKKAMILQAIPVVTMILGFGILFGLGFIFEQSMELLSFNFFVGIYILSLVESVVFFIVMVWNIVCGIKVFKK